MKRVLIASLLSLAAAPVFAASTPSPSFNDFPEQGQLEAGHAAAIKAKDLPQPSFNDQADLDALRANGVAGRAASEVAKPANVFWAPY